MEKITSYKMAAKNIYDYLCYIKGPDDKSEELKYLYQKSKEQENLENINYHKYLSEVLEYEKIIKMSATIIKELGFENNPTSYYAIYIYLLWNGYFSNNMKYKTQNNNLLNIRSLERIDIIYGKGCCRNNVNLMKHIFDKLGYKTHTLINTTLLYSVDYTLDHNIYQNSRKLIGERTYNMAKEEILTGNHANLLLEDNNNYYVYDPTNKLNFKLDKIFTADLYNGIGKCYVKPWGFIVFDHQTREEVIDMLEKIKNQDTSKFLTDKEITEIIIDSLNNCHKNKELLLEFRSLLEPHINNINKTMHKIK